MALVAQALEKTTLEKTSLRNMKKLFPLILSLASLTTFAQAPATATLHPVSTTFSERDVAISPDGSEMLYTIMTGQHIFSAIVYIRKEKNGWSAPAVAPFSGKFRDLEPAFSPDGTKIYFSSNRPVQGKSSTDFDIWVVDKVNGKWQEEAKNLGAPVNTTKDEFYPSATKSGNLYFTAEYGNGIGKEDIYVTSFVNGVYSQPVPLDTAVNSKTWEFNAFVSMDEKYILFTSYGRKDDSGGGDLYMSIKENGVWQKAKALTLINSKALDYCPFLSFDQKSLYFTSARHAMTGSYEKPVTYDQLLSILTDKQNGTDNIYWISFEEVLKSLR
jgi:Tol biopolymer transport system component